MLFRSSKNRQHAFDQGVQRKNLGTTPDKVGRRLFGLDRFQAGPIFTFARRMEAHIGLESFVSALKQGKLSPIPDRSQVVDVFAGKPRRESRESLLATTLQLECRLPYAAEPIASVK